MRKILPWLVGALVTLMAAFGISQVGAQQTTTPPIVAIACAYNTSPPAQTTGNFYLVQCGPSGGSPVVYTKPGALAPLGYQQISAGTLAASTSLTVPAGATFAVVQVEASTVRWRDDGTAATATVGMILTPGSTLTLSGAAELAAVQFILQSGSPILDVSYYK